MMQKTQIIAYLLFIGFFAVTSKYCVIERDLSKQTPDKISSNYSISDLANYQLQAQNENTWSHQSTNILKESCGSCHQSTASDPDPTALEIFDLDDPIWYVNLDPQIFESLLERAQGEEFTDNEREMIALFIEHEFSKINQ